jgi:hypothetical protein
MAKAPRRKDAWSKQTAATLVILAWLVGHEAPATTGAAANPLVRPGESRGRYICELLVSLPDSSA